MHHRFLLLRHFMYSQYIDPLRDDGSHKSASERKAGESMNRQENTAYWKVVTRYKSTGTQQGTFYGLDSSGKKVTIYETSIYRIANG